VSTPTPHQDQDQIQKEQNNAFFSSEKKAARQNRAARSKNDQDKKRWQSDKTRHASKRLGDYSHVVKNLCEQIKALPADNGQRFFNPYQLVQAATNKNAHPKAIIDALDSILALWPEIGDPWPYGISAITSSSSNYNEQDHAREAERFKNLWNADEQILELVRGIASQRSA
jgi:hypothetical protein